MLLAQITPPWEVNKFEVEKHIQNFIMGMNK
jgi:hypothetical protein